MKSKVYFSHRRGVDVGCVLLKLVLLATVFMGRASGRWNCTCRCFSSKEVFAMRGNSQLRV
jgi:hypothetical protein